MAWTATEHRNRCTDRGSWWRWNAALDAPEVRERYGTDAAWRQQGRRSGRSVEAPPRTERRMRCPGHLERTGRPPAREAPEPGQRMTHRRRPHGRGGCGGRSVGCRHPRDHESIRRRATESRLAVPVEKKGSLSTVLRRRRGSAARIGQRWRHLSPGTARRIAEA